jgi:Domain of unknown function (DUF6894)
MKMAQMYFHCVSSEEVMLDRRGSDFDDLSEACEHAEQIVRKCISTPGAQDWRRWTLMASDGDGQEVFVLPFATLLSKSH